MKLPPLTVIEASAGTGKTFSLVTRLMKLIFSGTAPERIVALTFSRMAAGEIFNSFIERLSKAAKSEKAAAEESVRMERELSAADFAAMLRQVISRQHLSLIGTLDSFLMRVVSMIPLELGLEGELSILSEYRGPVERMRLVGEMLMRSGEDAKNIFRSALKLAIGGSAEKSYIEDVSKFIEKWHAVYRDSCVNEDVAGLSREDAIRAVMSAWGGVERIWGANPPKWLDVTLGEIRSMADGLERHAGKRGADKFIEGVRNFNGTLPDPAPPVKLKDEDDALEAVAKMHAWRIRQSLDQTTGLFLLMHAYETAYAAKVRARGLITFDDVPRLLNALPDGVKLPLEYRMDSQFGHWALDEFQDTSREQWKALKNLIDEARQGDPEKSVFIVGDRKQSIYEWRGGDVEILGEEVKKAQEPGNTLEELYESYRYVPTISDAVNRVFDENSVRSRTGLDDAPESAKWKCGEHRSHEKEKPGFVEVIQATKKGSRVETSDFFEHVLNALEAVKPWERGISTAILVRQNEEGHEIVSHLKSNGITKVVFEGDSNIADCPVLTAMACMVKLAEHPKDGIAYSCIKFSPVAGALYPEGIPSAERLSAQLLEDFTRFGMVRKFREVREALKKIPDTWNAFIESRFEDFVKCASEFEEMRDATLRMSDFIAFLEEKTRRDFAEPGMVRVMSMHQSKGLGFDWVIIPFKEYDDMVRPKYEGAIGHSDPNWLVKYPGSGTVDTDDELKAADTVRRQKETYAALCVYYVAMTRAKRALTVILNPANSTKPKKGEENVAKKFSDIVRGVGLKTEGDRDWYLKLEKEKEEERKKNAANGKDGGNGESGDAPARPAPARGKRESVRKFRPSESFYSGLKGDTLFSDDFGKAARRGTDAHERYEKIEWLEPSEAKTEFDRALVKPEGAVALWREKSYEFCEAGRWESGQFDRVVFLEKGGERSAVVYDFKTNARRSGETEAAFAQRMHTRYSPQMAAYRHALAKLSDVPEERINCVLLLESTSSAVEAT